MLNNYNIKYNIMIMDKELDYYTNIGFRCTPLNGKVPIIKKWNSLDHTPEYKAFKNRNVGVVTGKQSNITILDIDYKDDGMKVWKLLSSLYPSFETPTVITPNKGIHMYFKYVDIPSTSKLKMNNKKFGWDILNDNRQAVLPPSIDNINKKKYKWMVKPTKTNIIKIPDWLLSYIKISKK